MFASHKLDAWVLPVDIDFIPREEDLSVLFDTWVAQGSLDSSRQLGGDKSTLIFAGGFSQVLTVKAPKHRFVANQQGGFRVFCHGVNITADFVQSLTKWRNGDGPREMMCPDGNLRAFEVLDFRPAAGFYRFALEFRDVGSAQLDARAAKQLAQLLGEIHIVYRRVG